MKFAEQNRNHTMEREFSINEAHIRYWRKQKEAVCKVNSSVTGVFRNFFFLTHSIPKFNNGY
jgi:aspartyl/asparaginyl-tRNA synthetase